MHQALYITAAGPLTGKNAIALEIMHMLGRDKNAAFFRPVIDVERDPVIDLMRQRFGITVEVADAYGCTRDEARQLINAGKRGQLIETVLRKYKKLLDAHDFVLCLGTNFADRDAVTEFGLNAEIAANLGCPVLLVADGGRADAAA